MGIQNFDIRQSELRVALPNVGTIANDTVDVVLQAIDSAIGGGQVTIDLATTNRIIAVGHTLMYPYLIIDTGVTFTINGQLVGITTLTVNGTLTINGEVRVL